MKNGELSLSENDLKKGNKIIKKRKILYSLSLILPENSEYKYLAFIRWSHALPIIFISFFVNSTRKSAKVVDLLWLHSKNRRSLSPLSPVMRSDSRSMLAYRMGHVLAIRRRVQIKIKEKCAEAYLDGAAIR